MYTIELSDKELTVVLDALVDGQFKKVVDVYFKIRQQVAVQKEGGTGGEVPKNG